MNNHFNNVELQEKNNINQVKTEKDFFITIFFNKFFK